MRYFYAELCAADAIARGKRQVMWFSSAIIGTTSTMRIEVVLWSQRQFRPSMGGKVP
jgi:hypothetical protein